jgi:hypothetical protein
MFNWKITAVNVTMFSNLLTDVIATSIVAVTVPALAVPISFG